MRKLPTLILTLLLALTFAGCEASTVTSEPDQPTDTTDGDAADADTDGDDAGDDEPDPQQTAAVGDSITLAGTDDQLRMRVSVDEVIDPATPTNDFDDAGEGRRYVGVRVTLENVGDGAYDDSPGNGATLIDADNQQYNEVVVSESFTECQLLGYSVTMPPGDTRSGCIAFAIPEGATPDRFQFALDSGFAPQTGVWTLAAS